MLDAAAVWSHAKAPRPGAEGAYGVFETADGERVAVAVLEEEMWRRLCAAFGWQEWLADPEFADHEARRASAERVTNRLRSELAARPLDEIVALAARHDLGISRVNQPAEGAADPQLRARDIYPDPEHWRPLGAVAARLPLKYV